MTIKVLYDHPNVTVGSITFLTEEANMFENIMPDIVPIIIIIVCLVSMVGLTVMILHGLWVDHKDRIERKKFGG